MRGGGIGGGGIEEDVAVVLSWVWEFRGKTDVMIGDDADG